MNKISIAQSQLKSLVERIERLEEEKQAIAGDIREIYSEAKANGFDTKILRKVIAVRKLDQAERQEQEAMLDVYFAALGMQPSLFDEEEPRGADASTTGEAAGRHGPGTLDVRSAANQTPAPVPPAGAPGHLTNDQGTAEAVQGGPAEGCLHSVNSADAGQLISEPPPVDVPCDAAVQAAAEPPRFTSPSAAADQFPEMPTFLDRRGPRVPTVADFLAAG